MIQNCVTWHHNLTDATFRFLANFGKSFQYNKISIFKTFTQNFFVYCFQWRSSNPIVLAPYLFLAHFHDNWIVLTFMFWHINFNNRGHPRVYPRHSLHGTEFRNKKYQRSNKKKNKKLSMTNKHYVLLL